MNEAMRYTLVILLLLINVLICSGQLTRQPYYFDCGSGDSEVAEGAQLFTPADQYSASRGFGWVDPTGKAFVNKEFSRSRDDFNIDGISGQTLDLRADVPTGEWWVTLFVDAGYEDSSTIKLKINDEFIDLNWHAFQPPAEPRQVLQPSYRVYQGAFKINDFIRITLMGGDHDARLLGLTLMPNPSPINDEQKSLATEIQSLGKYSSDIAVANVYDKLKELSAANPRDPFHAYWFQQIDLLYRAEDHFMKRGWEKYIPITGLSIWGQLHQAVMILDGMLNHPTSSSGPLYERARMLRGRILYWLGLERGGPNEISRGAADLAALYQLYPEDELLAMYNGERIDLPDPCDDLVVDPNAPAWSNKQRELLCRMRNIAHWWVLEQQAENGEFGGKLGDDVEILRWWTPLLLSGDTTSFLGWSKLADEVFKSRKVYKGYSKHPIDVEHGSEFIADTAPIMVVCSDEPVYLDRLNYSVDYFQNLWTGITDQGHRFFRSAWYSSTEVDERPPRNRDLGYNSRAAKAVRYYAWKTQDQATIKALNEWSDGWLSAAMRTDKDKPKGIIPASVRFPDESFNGDEPTWYRANMFWRYFEWEPKPGSMILDQLLFSYTITRDEKYLQPLMKSLELIQKYEGADGDHETGSEGWAADILKAKGSFWGVAAQWRLITGDQRFDALLTKYGTPYLKYRLTEDEAFLEDGLERALENCRYNTPLKTTEAIHTDRVDINGYEHLTTMLTGNGSGEGLSPYFGMTWENTDEHFTALVRESSFEKLSVDIYSHADEPGNTTMRLWQLEPGRYKVVINGDRKNSKMLKLESQGQRLEVLISGHELINVEIAK